MRFRPRRVGQASIEFALVAPLYFLLLLGIIDVGRGTFAAVVLANATREGARHAATGWQQSDWQVTTSGVVRDFAAGLPSEQVSVETSIEIGDGVTYAKVRASYPFSPIVPGVAALFGPSTINSTATAVAN
jgi:Flp pilus assembly protein TadG